MFFFLVTKSRFFYLAPAVAVVYYMIIFIDHQYVTIDGAVWRVSKRMLSEALISVYILDHLSSCQSLNRTIIALWLQTADFHLTPDKARQLELIATYQVAKNSLSVESAFHHLICCVGERFIRYCEFNLGVIISTFITWLYWPCWLPMRRLVVVLSLSALKTVLVWGQSNETRRPQSQKIFKH